jgi:hypothetical protein
MSAEAERTYFWDFFGPRAEPTAAHFARHLRDFLSQHGLSDSAIVTESTSALHHVVGVTTGPRHFELIEKALRPKRHA